VCLRRFIIFFLKKQNNQETYGQRYSHKAEKLAVLAYPVSKHDLSSDVDVSREAINLLRKRFTALGDKAHCTAI
jgi:hypothetical protein